jgi:hypothetical protein
LVVAPAGSVYQVPGDWLSSDWPTAGVVRETTLQSSQPIPSLEVGGEELFPESVVTRPVELVIAPRWKMAGCLVALRPLALDGADLCLRELLANLSKMGFDDNSPDERKCESSRIYWFRWWAGRT